MNNGMVLKKIGWIIFLSILIAGFLLSGCEKNVSKSSTPTGTPQSLASASYLNDYFPIDAGREWVYRITLDPSIEPRFYRETAWQQMSGKEQTAATIGGYFTVMSLIHKETPKDFFLKIKVKEPASGYPRGAELIIEKDDIGVFWECKRIVWATTAGGDFMAQQIVTYPPNSSGSPVMSKSGFLPADGSSMRLMLIEVETGKGMGVADSLDVLYFKGIETNLAGYDGKSCAHFQRIVKLSKTNFAGLNKDFTEDTWWVKEIGLVRLEQKVEGKTSMVWTLEK